ncbi:MAG: thioredoxin-disulfide reductase [Odoribacteraceae bacterium]|nr:thioredoxin-disulfide reductase [Odoribacteraceae bacterium]
MTERVKCLIIGSGPAGYTAAIYAARANLAPVLYTGLRAGGQLTTTTEVENFPGYPEGVTGPVMMEDMRKQAERFGTNIRFGIVTSVDFSAAPREVTIDGGQTIAADAIIIATGATARYLGLPSEERFRGSGVSACATCDGFFYRGKDVAVVGGGDTACEEAIYLSGLCREVHLIVRKNHLRASKVMQQRVFDAPNINVLFEHNTVELFGTDMGLEGVRLARRAGEPDASFTEIRVDGFFLAIGHVPNTDIFKEYLQLDAAGYIITEGTSTRTNVPGVFAAGDVMDPVYRQGITSAASGCKAAIDAERYLVMGC